MELWRRPVSHSVRLSPNDRQPNGFNPRNLCSLKQYWAKEIDEALPVTKVDGDHVITERYMENVIAPPFWQMALRGNHLADDVPLTVGNVATSLRQVMFTLK